MNIGKFQQDNGAYTGRIDLLNLSLPARITRTDLKGIDYVVTVPATGAELGVGWNEVGKEKGTKYISVKLDSPFLFWPTPVYCSLFEQEDGSYNLVWNRQKPKKEAAGEQLTA
jgi:uncharacterized protein (DUF736 family)